MIHTCLTSHIYLNWCFDLSACFDQVWEDSLIADADQKKIPIQSTMDVLPSGNIFRELQVVHDTGYFSAQPSLEDRWQQVCVQTNAF